MPAPDHSHSMSPTDRSRLDRLEEGLAFTERAVEQLSTEIADINRRVQAITKRLAAIELRLAKPQGDANSPASDEDHTPASPDAPG